MNLPTSNLLTRAILATLPILLFASCAKDAAVGEANEGGQEPQARILLSAHRGGPAHWPENTIPAFHGSIALGVQILEFDMNLTADDQVVLHHDTTVNPVICQPDASDPVAHGPIRELTLRQAQSFDCGATPPREFPDQRPMPGVGMPSLDEFLVAVKDSDTVLFGETKMPKGDQIDSVDPELFVQRISEAVQRHGLEQRFILQSGDYRTIDAMHRVNPRIRTCLLRMGEAKPDFVGMARRHNAGCVVMRLDYGDAGDIRMLKDSGLIVYSDVADREEQWDAYVELGVDAILTNNPVALRAYLERKGLRAP